jgi:hypothetical protein
VSDLADGRVLLCPTAAIVAVVLAFSGCGGDGSDQTSTVARPSADPPNFHQTRYDVEIFNGWPQDVSDKKVGGYLESSWHDPASAAVTITIDSRASDETGSPRADAELAQIQTSKLPGYRERGLKRIKLGGRPAVQWAFDVPGEARVDYFFEECGTSIVVLGSTTPVSFEALSESFREMAATIKVACDE